MNIIKMGDGTFINAGQISFFKDGGQSVKVWMVGGKKLVAKFPLSVFLHQLDGADVVSLDRQVDQLLEERDRLKDKLQTAQNELALLKELAALEEEAP